MEKGPSPDEEDSIPHVRGKTSGTGGYLSWGSFGLFYEECLHDYLRGEQELVQLNI